MGTNSMWGQPPRLSTDANGNTVLVGADGVINLGPAAYTWAGKPTPASSTGQTIRVTDVGMTSFGSLWCSNGTRWAPVNGSVALYEVPATHPVSDGTTVEAVVIAVPLLAGMVQDGDILEVCLDVNKSGTSDSNTTQLFLGTVAGTKGNGLNVNMAQPATTNLRAVPLWRIKRISATSIGPINANGALGLGTSSTAYATVTGLPDMDTQTTYLQVTAKMATGGIETVTFDSCLVILRAQF